MLRKMSNAIPPENATQNTCSLFYVITKKCHFLLLKGFISENYVLESYDTFAHHFRTGFNASFKS